MTASIILKGGFLMYPLLLCSVLSLALILEKSILIMKLRIKNSLYSSILDLAEKRDFANLKKLTSSESSKSTPPAVHLVSDIIEGTVKSPDEYKMLIGITVYKIFRKNTLPGPYSKDYSDDRSHRNSNRSCKNISGSFSFRLNSRPGNTCRGDLGGNDNNNNRTSCCNTCTCSQPYPEKPYQQLLGQN